MKEHIKALLISIVLISAGVVLSKNLVTDFSAALIEQAKAVSYFVTLAGIVSAFSWYKRTATKLDFGTNEVPATDVVKQNRVLVYLVIINFINAGVIIFSTEKSILLMSSISLLVIAISPVIFRTMQEKEATPTEKSPKEKENS